MDTPAHLAAHLNRSLADRYEIVREAGAGGMATVFLARDLKHNRQVAIKVLKPDLAATLGPERFLREVQIAAQLQHPHILPVFDSGDAEGTLWYAMPFIDGESLRQRLARTGALPIGETIQLVREVAGALGKAHAAGVVHRDIKPENILLSDGHALVADFGVAKALSTAKAGGTGLTSAGMSLGTPGYMAPEQVAADPNADHRTDIYSLGIVAWEMLAGRAPFAELPPAQQLAAHVTTMPAAIESMRADCPPLLSDAIARCIAKDPNARPKNADELRAILDGASGVHLPLSGARAAVKPHSRARQIGTLVGAAAIISAAYLAVRDQRTSSAPVDATPSLAVLPFATPAGDSATAYFGDGIAEEIIGAVSRVRGLNVASRSVSFRHRGRDVDVVNVGREIGVSHVLEGSVQRAGTRVRVNVTLTDTRSGFNAWSERYDRELTDIFAVEDEIATKVAQALDVQLAGGGASRRKATTNTEAHDQYLLGLAARGARDLATAAARFSRAIELDVAYADAHAGLASVLVLYPEYGLTARPDLAIADARAAATKALELDSTQSAAHLALGYAAKVFGRDHAGAEREYAKSLALNPNSPEGHHWNGELLMERGRFADARVAFEASVARDPAAPASTAMLAMALFRISANGGPATVDSAIAVCKRTTEISPAGGVFPFEFACGSALTRVKRYADARPHLTRAGRALGDSTVFVTLMTAAGDAARLRAAIALIDAKSGGARPTFDPMIAAVWYLLLGDQEKTITALEAAERGGSPFASFVEVLDFSALLNSPRLEAVRSKLGYQ